MCRAYFAGRADRSEVPANERPEIPFDGLERLCYWHGKRAGQETRRALRKSRSALWTFHKEVRELRLR